MSIFWPSRDERLQDLLGKAVAGDREAFRSLYRGLYDEVARFVGRRIANREDAEDLVARTFHRFLEGLGRFDARRGTVRMFVLSIARNALIDHLRASRAGVPLEEIAATLADDSESALDALVEDESERASAHEARALVSELPAPTREILVLRYGDGLSHSEIAALTGASESAIKQKVSRALRDLKERRRSRGTTRSQAPDETNNKGVLDVRA
jgi:RNA polymerase sigma-70 factor (ECF subfamily)